MRKVSEREALWRRMDDSSEVFAERSDRQWFSETGDCLIAVTGRA